MKNQTTVTTLSSFILLTLLVLGMSASLAFASEEDIPTIGSPSISESTALGIANKAYIGAGAFSDIELEMEMGVLVFAVEYTEKDGNEVDVKVDAKTGAVIVIESDKDEAIDDDAGDTDEDEESEKIANVQTLINLLNQLVALFRQKTV